VTNRPIYAGNICALSTHVDGPTQRYRQALDDVNNYMRRADTYTGGMVHGLAANVRKYALFVKESEVRHARVDMIRNLPVLLAAQMVEANQKGGRSAFVPQKSWLKYLEVDALFAFQCRLQMRVFVNGEFVSSDDHTNMFILHKGACYLNTMLVVGHGHIWGDDAILHNRRK
jgi:hypothetical protein